MMALHYFPVFTAAEVGPADGDILGMVFLCLCPRRTHHCMAAAFQEVPYFRLTSLVKSIHRSNKYD